MKICEGIKKLTEGINLSADEVVEIMEEVKSSKATSAQIGGFLIALKMKGESKEEVLGVVKFLRSNMEKVNFSDDALIDTCGTGGDFLNTFNISTCSAIIAASGGAKVAKHGNRGVSSLCGSSDVLDILKINTKLYKDKSEELIKKCGIGFLFAPNYHSVMKSISNERRELKTRTIFNLVGPIVNPANLSGQLMGIYDEKYLKIVCEVLRDIGLKRALVVHGKDGLDEISISTKTKVCELKEGKIFEYDIEPKMFGLRESPLESIKGGNPEYNARIILDILKGEEGAKRDIVLLNAGACLYVANKVKSIKEGIDFAKKLIDDGTAYKKYLEIKDNVNIS